MHPIKEKLKTNRGVTILFALGLLMIFFLLAAVILGAALGNMTTVSDRSKQRQAYLSKSSAAQMVAEGLGDMRCEYTKNQSGALDTCKFVVDLSPTAPAGAKNVCEVIAGTDTEIEKATISEVSNYETIANMALAVVGGATSAQERTLTITPNDAAVSDTMGTIYVTMTMKPLQGVQDPGQLIITFSNTLDKNQNDVVELIYSATKSEGDTSKIYWTNPKVQEKGRQ